MLVSNISLNLTEIRAKKRSLIDKRGGSKKPVKKIQKKRHHISQGFFPINTQSNLGFDSRGNIKEYRTPKNDPHFNLSSSFRNKSLLKSLSQIDQKKSSV